MKLIVLAAIGAVIAVPAAGQQQAPKTAEVSPPEPAGYQPPPSPPAPPNATYIQAPPPDVAFPPPAPLPSYPFCKRGQFDKCLQRHDPK